MEGEDETAMPEEGGETETPDAEPEAEPAAEPEAEPSDGGEGDGGMGGEEEPAA